jgi:acyl-CoA synthetase (AMP-forming)/AMP-acid ligase II
VLEEVSVPGVIDAIHRHGITIAVLVPAVILALVQHPDAARADLNSLRRLIYGASPIADDTVRRAKALLPGAELWQVYGATESNASGTTLAPRFLQEPDSKIRSCGRPYPGVEVRVVDPDGDPVATGQVGEIVIRAAAVMKGYWNNPESTRAAFFSGGWLRTGDAGYFDADGFLYIHDRIKDMIISGAACPLEREPWSASSLVAPGDICVRKIDLPRLYRRSCLARHRPGLRQKLSSRYPATVGNQMDLTPQTQKP